jgi:hypothetical protein
MYVLDVTTLKLGAEKIRRLRRTPVEPRPADDYGKTRGKGWFPGGDLTFDSLTWGHCQDASINSSRGSATGEFDDGLRGSTACGINTADDVPNQLITFQRTLKGQPENREPNRCPARWTKKVSVNVIIQIVAHPG